MSRTSVRFQDSSVDLDIPPGKLVAAWHGPRALDSSAIRSSLVDRLENPADFPALKLAVVPGDRVAVPLGSTSPLASAILESTCQVLETAGVATGDITVVTPGPLLLGETPPLNLIHGIVHHQHDPQDRAQLAYLAATAKGRRVYLNRHVTDADFVLPIGDIWFDPIQGIKGPWSILFPGLSDLETYREVDARSHPGPERIPRALDDPELRESAEVCWLLGCQFQVGLIPGVDGFVEVTAGLGDTVMQEGIEAIGRHWEFQVESRAELVIVGVGAPGRPTSFEQVARGLATGSRLVQRGGKLVILSRASGELGPATASLRGQDTPRQMLASLKRMDEEGDLPLARALAESLAWADVYLLADLDRELVEDLGIIALDHAEEAGRLAALSGSCTVLSQGDRTLVVVRDAEAS